MKINDFTRNYEEEAIEIYKDPNKTIEEKTKEIKNLEKEIYKEIDEMKSIFKQIYMAKGCSEEHTEKMFDEKVYKALPSTKKENNLN